MDMQPTNTGNFTFYHEQNVKTNIQINKTNM